MSAIDRITHYVAMREAKPMRGMADEIHGIHAGEEWEARLFLSDIKEIASAIRAQAKRIRELDDLTRIEYHRAEKAERSLKAAESRLAAIDAYRGEAEKVAEKLSNYYWRTDEDVMLAEVLVPALLAARMEGAEAEREACIGELDRLDNRYATTEESNVLRAAADMIRARKDTP